MKDNLNKIASRIRYNIIKALMPSVSHHIGCSLGIVELLTYLYFQELKIDPKNPKDNERDIFILSKGHAGIALFSTLSERGYFGQEVLDGYDQDGGTIPEHATTVVPGVELSTGSLGHGLPVALGLAVDFKVTESARRAIVLMSDGEMNEGSNWEAIMFAGHHKLANLVAIVDDNGFQGYGETEKIINIGPISKKVELFGWETYEIDGHDFKQMEEVFERIRKNTSNKPSMIIAKTLKGKGVSQFEGKFESHYHSIDMENKEKLLTEMEKNK